MDVDIVLVPYDSGVRNWRMGNGPDALLHAGLDDHLKRLGHHVRTEVIAVEGNTRLTELQISFQLLRLIAPRVHASISARRFPLVLAGNCLTSCAILAAMGEVERTVFWFDAHGDLNTPETTPSGFVDGMALATALGWCWQSLTRTIPGFTPITPDRCCLIGARSLDPPERDAIGRHGIAQDVTQFLARPAVRNSAAYVHCDLDALDPGVARVNQFPAPGGLSSGAYVSAIRSIVGTTAVKAAALTAYDPAADPEKTVPPIALEIAAALVTK